MPHKLLLADDSVTIQRVIELTFADEDVDVIAVGDGQQAINHLKLERPDIVLADIGMPERDGYEVAAFIKKSPELSHIPVLLLTGAFEPIDEARARAAGCDGVLVKPFEPQLVITRVKDLISGKRPVAEPAPAASPSPTSSSGSVDEYFDRLGSLAEELATWNPDLDARPAGTEATAGQPSPEHVEGRTPTLSQAFAALLAAEQGKSAPNVLMPQVAIDEATIDRIAQRVVERMGERDMRAAVLEVAERLVAEEIARIKSHAG